MGNLGATELLIIAVVVVLLFGTKKMPDMARSLGRSMRIIKAETTGMRRDEQDEVGEARRAPSTPAAAPAQATLETMQKQIDELRRQLAHQQSAQQPQPTATDRPVAR